MGATSVTGTGVGSAEGSLKGPGNGRNIYVPLLTPHVVAAGSGTLGTNVLTVTFPEPLAGGGAKYVVMAISNNSTVAGHGICIPTKTDSDGEFVSFQIKGEAASDEVMWLVVSGAVDATI